MLARRTLLAATFSVPARALPSALSFLYLLRSIHTITIGSSNDWFTRTCMVNASPFKTLLNYDSDSYVTKMVQHLWETVEQRVGA